MNGDLNLPQKIANGNGFHNKNLVRSEWKVNASVVAKNTFNPIRDIMETMEFTPNPEKKMISLALGDPTVYKNLNPAPEVVEAVRDSLIGGLRNGYGPSTGFVDARQAVADGGGRHTSRSMALDVQSAARSFDERTQVVLETAQAGAD